ncbi:Uncharacterised protein [Bordetella pertussis]|nr:Uncharacterised protein [Bordetella pertussis]
MRISLSAVMVLSVNGARSERAMMSSTSAPGRWDRMARPPAVQNVGTLCPTRVAKKVSRLLCRREA